MRNHLYHSSSSAPKGTSKLEASANHPLPIMKKKITSHHKPVEEEEKKSRLVVHQTTRSTSLNSTPTPILPSQHRLPHNPHKASPTQKFLCSLFSSSLFVRRRDFQPFKTHYPVLPSLGKQKSVERRCRSRHRLMKNCTSASLLVLLENRAGSEKKVFQKLSSLWKG